MFFASYCILTTDLSSSTNPWNIPLTSCMSSLADCVITWTWKYGIADREQRLQVVRLLHYYTTFAYNEPTWSTPLPDKSHEQWRILMWKGFCSTVLPSSILQWVQCTLLVKNPPIKVKNNEELWCGKVFAPQCFRVASCSEYNEHSWLKALLIKASWV